MKKFLALVLALVMTLGLAAVSSNAAYNDAADVDLAEAVDVMSAVGVFQGSDGKFDPKANLTREQAAKLIAYLDLGEKAAEALPAIKVFDDVEASRWSAKYIAYCQDAGYIAGVGDNKFNPTGELTGYAFGKMVLCVLGYDAAIEGFTGASWSINVAKLMESNDINDEVDGSASATLTREQAAQYCLNALKATMVEYDTKGTSIEINGAKIATGASKASDVAQGNYANSLKKANLQLGEKLYKGDLKLSNPDDDFGAPSTKWEYKNSDVGTYNDAPDATYTNKVTMGTIYTLLGKDVVDDLTAGNAKLNYFTNGVDADAVAAGEAANADHTTPAYQAAYAAHNDRAANAVKNSTGAAFGTGDGTLTEVYIDDDGVTIGTNTYAKITVVVKNTYLLQATADYNTKTEKLSVKTLTGPSIKTSLSVDDFDVEDYKNDDYILYTYAAGDIQTLEKAEIVSGKVDTYTTGKNVTLDGTKYVVSAVASAELKDNTADFGIGDTAKIVVDKLGFAVYIDEAKASNDDIVFVTDIEKAGFTVNAKIVNVDGSKRTIDVDTDDSDGAAKAGAPAAEGLFWAYEVDGSQYELTGYAKQTTVKSTKGFDGVTEGDKITLNKVTSLQGDDDEYYTANSKTVYIVADDDDDITVYTGVKNAPDITKYCSKVQFAYNNDKEITYLYVKSNSDSGIDDATQADELVYVLKKGDTIKGSDKKDYTVFTVLINGEETKVNAKSADTLEVGSLYEKLKTNSDGYVTGATKIAPANYDTAAEWEDADYAYLTVTNQKDAFDYSDGVITVKSTVNFSKFIKTDKVYVVVAKNGGALLDDAAASYELTETDFAGLETFVKGYYANAYVWVTLNSDGEVTAAYVTITASSTNSLAA